MVKDYYKILRISKNASPEEIKNAYYKLARQYHPDKGGDEEKFKEINEAYQVLADADKRAQYDKFGRVFEGSGAAGGEPGFGPGGFDFRWGWGSQPGEGMDFDFGDLSDVFEEMFGFESASQRRDRKRGKDIEVEMEIPLEAVLKRQEKEITINKMAVCSRCQGSGVEPGTPKNECFSCRGTGEVQQIRRTVFGSFTRSVVCPECGGEGSKPVKPCNVCRGEGRIKTDEKIKVSIPAGIDNNQVIKMTGKGEAGKKGGKPGDLYLKIFIREHPVFNRKGDDLYLSLPITFSQAGLGDEIEVPTLEGTKIILTVPAGLESGKIFRISGKGTPRFSGYGRGNLFVKLIVKTPAKLTKKQKDLLEEMRKQGL